MTTWFRMLFAELPLLRDLPDRERPLPRVAVTLGSTVPGWLLRTAAAVASGGALAVGTQRLGMNGGFAWALVGIATVVMAIWPATAVAHMVLVVTGLLIALDGHGPFDPVVFALIPLAYAAVRLAWWAERVAPAARVEVAALRRGLGRGLALVCGTLGLAALAFLLAGEASTVAVTAGGVALIVLTWLVLAARRASSRPERARAGGPARPR